jgi:hypothetical protein
MALDVHPLGAVAGWHRRSSPSSSAARRGGRRSTDAARSVARAGDRAPGRQQRRPAAFEIHRLGAVAIEAPTQHPELRGLAIVRLVASSAGLQPSRSTSSAR